MPVLTKVVIPLKDWKKLERVSEKTGRSIPSLLISGAWLVCLFHKVRIDGEKVFIHHNRQVGKVESEIIVRF